MKKTPSQAKTAAATEPAAGPDPVRFAPFGAERLLVIGGIMLIAGGMIFGDIFAVFVLHQNAARVGESLVSATKAVTAGDTAAVSTEFTSLGDSLENRGTKVDTHVHAIDFGYLALLLALLQPYVALPERRKKQAARLFLTGALLLPVSVFLIHYVGLDYSPLKTIGWASIFADLGGLFVIIACVVQIAGLSRRFRLGSVAQDSLTGASNRCPASRVLLTGGALLILAGFAHGAYYASFRLHETEALESSLLREMTTPAASHDPAPHHPGALLQSTAGGQQAPAAASRAVAEYGELQGFKAVNIAAHSHIIEFGLLAMLLALIQPYVFLSDRWKLRWAIALLAGSVVLPVFVLLEVNWGLVAGAIADAGGLLVIIALIAVLLGIARHTGRLDPGRE